MYKINGNPEEFADLGVFHKLSQQFLPFAQKRMQFDKPVGINLISDPENAKNPLGKTAYYNPGTMEVTVFVDNRHVKDILRSMSHELVHHTQNCRGEFENGVDTGPGYAQEDGHMRKMEEEAYLEGQMTLRDFEDNLKKENKVMAEVKNKKKADLDKDGKLSSYEKKRGKAIEKSMAADGETVDEGIFAPNHYCVHHGGVQMEGKVKLGKVIGHNWSEDLQKVTKYNMKLEDGTILENVNAEDIFVTEASLANEHAGHMANRDDEELEEAKETVNMLDPKPGQEKEAARLRAASRKTDAKLQPKFDKIEKEVAAMKKSDKAKRAAKDAADRILPDEEVAKLTRPLSGDEDKAVAKPALEENWTRKNKDQLLFERLIEKWIK
jgi:hypothetical protein